MPRPRRRLRSVIGCVSGLAVAWFVLRPAVFLAWVMLHDSPVAPRALPAGRVDDQSGLEESSVVGTVLIPRGREAASQALRALLARAEREDLPVSIAGSRHSMGGHTIAPEGLVADMTDCDALSYDDARGTLTAGAGATWGEVLAYLDPLGQSVAVMQSNDSFTVGGSLSVNCHGWQHGRAPIAETVRALRVMLADGRLVECSREVEPELFSLVLGGYGLFGVIIDADLEVVPNERYRHATVVMPAAELGATFLARVSEPAVGMAIGRLSIAPDGLLDEALLKVLERVEPSGPLPPIAPSGSRALRRAIFRGSVGSDYGKALRWSLERRFSAGSGGTSTRNAELAEPVGVYANDDPRGVDLLFEAFVPHAQLDAYRRAIRPHLEASDCDLLNMTVRDVRRDDLTCLRYADVDMFALVMLFHVARTPRGDDALRDLTRGLIDEALALGGRYDLPYRLHATREQFERAYPMASEFFAAKRRYDPLGRFRTQFLAAYGPD